MKIGIFSDIHGNLAAFETIYRELKKESCDLHLFLGDICGYYYRQADTIELLSDFPRLEMIAGNHDAMFLKALTDKTLMENYTRTYGLSFELLKESISPRHLDILRGLGNEFHLKEEGIAAFHGSPWNPLEEYIYPDADITRFAELPYRVVFLGHTHYPMDRRLDNIRVINPGSAGQPRDGGWPSYSIYETESAHLEIKHVQYNVRAVLTEIEKVEKENEYLIRVLQRIEGWQN